MHCTYAKLFFLRSRTSWQLGVSPSLPFRVSAGSSTESAGEFEAGNGQALFAGGAVSSLSVLVGGNLLMGKAPKNSLFLGHSEPSCCQMQALGIATLSIKRFSLCTLLKCLITRFLFLQEADALLFYRVNMRVGLA